MMKRKITFGLILILIIMPCVILLGINYVYGYVPFIYEPPEASTPRGTAGWDTMGMFSMKTATILSSLDRGETDLFTPETAESLGDAVDTMYAKAVLIPGTIPWTQADYWDVANALNSYVWRDSLDDWKLLSMSFFTTCQDNVGGFRSSDFLFVKTKFERGKLSDVWRGVFLFPEQEGGLWAETESRHRFGGWKKINLSRLVVTADDALRIAEENGGREYRAEIQNECVISVYLSAEKWFGWSVRIGDFEIYIDPYTGDIIQ